MPIPAKKDFDFYAGDDEAIKLILKDPADSPIDLTGYQAKIQLKITKVSDTVELEKMATITPLAGEILFEFAGSELSVGSFVYDIELVSGSSKIRTLLKGYINVVEDVTE